MGESAVKGIKSVERVKESGEVFTPDSIVNDMLDLVDKEIKVGEESWDEVKAWEYIDKTYLEPACGTGNFLIRILDRKLHVVQTKLPKEKWGVGLLHSLSSIYAIDIQEDNVKESKERIIGLIKNGSTEVLEIKDKEIQPFHFEPYDISPSGLNLEKQINFILESNIMLGNFLTGNVCKACKDQDKQMLITEYTWSDDETRDKLSIRRLQFNNVIKESNILYDVTEDEIKRKNFWCNELGTVITLDKDRKLLDSKEVVDTNQVSGVSESDEWDF